MKIKQQQVVNYFYQGVKSQENVLNAIKSDVLLAITGTVVADVYLYISGEMLKT